jgi:hypothetical protein
VAHAELGRRPASAEFWELADEALGAGGSLTARGTRIKDLTKAMRAEQHRLDKARYARRVSQILTLPCADDATTAAPAMLPPAISAPIVGRCPHCHQPVTLVSQIVVPPDTGRRPGLLIMWRISVPESRLCPPGLAVRCPRYEGKDGA